MNRRTLLKGTLGVCAYALVVPDVYAKGKKSKTEDNSKLYGNAWGVLPKASKGEIEIVLSGIATETDSDFGDTQHVYGVIHNNSDDERVVRKIDVPGATTDEYPGVWPLTIQPRSYAVFRDDEIKFEGDPNDDLSGMTAVFEEPEASYDFRMEIKSFERTETGIKIEVKNRFKEYDVPPGWASGLVIWFDSYGNLIGEETFDVDVEDPLAPGKSRKLEIDLVNPNVDSSALFLVGVTTMY